MHTMDLALRVYRLPPHDEGESQVKKIVAAAVGAACGLALAIGGAAWASDGGKPSAPAPAAAPQGSSAGCC
jgi:hypothetical protein